MITQQSLLTMDVLNHNLNVPRTSEKFSTYMKNVATHLTMSIKIGAVNASLNI